MCNVSVAARYDARAAQAAARRRRVAKGERSRKVRGWLKELVERKLRLAWSPEQIRGRLRLEMGIGLSHETIYQHVIRDARGQGALRHCLRFGGYKHHRFKKSKMADALLTIVDRKSRYSRIRRVQKVDTEHVAPATIEALDTDDVDVVESITNDNGAEFQGDAKLQKTMGVPIYFTDPSSPWQRGSIENLNGLIRQYVPKSTDIDQATRLDHEGSRGQPEFSTPEDPGLSVAPRGPLPPAARSDIQSTNALRIGIQPGPLIARLYYVVLPNRPKPTGSRQARPP